MARIRTIKPAELWTEIAVDDAAGYWLYCVVEDGCEETGPCKVGIATNTSKRLSSLQDGNHRLICFAWLIRVLDRDRAKDAEQSCLMRFRPSPYGEATPRLRLASEWIAATPQEALAHAVDRLNVEGMTVRRTA